MLNEDKEHSTGENVAVRSVENPPMTRNESARILDSCLSLEPRLEQVTEEGDARKRQERISDEAHVSAVFLLGAPLLPASHLNHDSNRSPKSEES